MSTLKARCRPGDLALIVGDTVNSGLIVKVLRRYAGTDWEYDWQGPTWLVSSPAPLTWTIVETGVDHVDHEGPMPDFCLHPIRGQHASCRTNLRIARDAPLEAPA